ncbi:MAG: SIR2 family protein [Planctomycetaceae bacterium]|nr:SIR2 family protein [Planctomycetaceae bacterium]
MPRIPDYAYILNEVRRNLHDPRGSRAAVMVGAGFSRNAVPLQSIRTGMPMWQDLVSELVKRLYSEGERELVLGESSATSSALRLAQEFETAFGRPALIELVRETIGDDAFAPGKLHRKLLELPWADVFTTNYDCLLEKASQSVWRQRYEVIRGMTDIPVARRPRIVKLHGTLPELENMVLTEDDFRGYPGCRAPFVNLVQTSLAENSFCLFGFSGDDPNFLNWTGWVRDELGGCTPFIYFFMYSDVRLQAFQRRLLESRRIIPIDLRQLYPDYDVADAHEQLLSDLREPLGPPIPSWNSPRRYANYRIDPSIAKEPLFPHGREAEGWKQAIQTWRRHRERYQGWVVLPQHSLERLAENVSSWMSWANAKLVQEWTIVDRLSIVRELAWRAATASTPLYDEFVFQVVDPLLKEVEVGVHGQRFESDLESWKLTRDGFDIAVRYVHLQVLRHAREIGDDSRFDELLAKCESDCSHLAEGDDARQFIEYQVVLRELGRLDHVTARSALSSWRTQGASPIWKVRRAALLLECGEIDQGRRRLGEAFHQVRNIPIEPTDYESLTTEGSVLTVLRCLRQSDESNVRPQRRPNSQTTSTEQLDSYSVADDVGTSVRAPEPAHFVAPAEAVVGFDETESELRQFSDVDDREVIERLQTLSERGCDPGETLNWFEDILEFRPQKQLGRYVLETYEIGRVSHQTTSGDNPPLQRAYQAIRFLEDAAVPLRVDRTIAVSVASKVFADAAMMIAEVSSQEGLGLVLRSRNSKLVKEYLSRTRMSSATDAQVTFLHSAGLKALSTALSKMGLPPPTRTDTDTFWERQVEIACIVLDRVSARLTQEQLRSLLGELLPLSWDKRLMGRVNAYDDLNHAIRRCCTLLDGESISELLPTLLRSPVLGSQQLPKSALRVGEWIDPIIASKGDQVSLAREQLATFSQAAIDLLTRCGNAGTDERSRLISRLFALRRCELLSIDQQKRLADVLYQNVDDTGVPSGIDILPTYAVLRLPRPPEIKERQVFRKGIIDQPDENIWRTLAFSVSRFGPPREQRQRSINWTKGDLNAILELATKWIAQKYPPKPKPDDDGLATFLGGTQDLTKIHYRAWLQVIEEIVLLAPNRGDKLLQAGCDAIQTARNHGFHTLKAWPTLVQLNRMNAADVSRAIRLGLSSSDDDLVWHACCGIVRWAELERGGNPISLPSRCLQILGTLVLERRHTMLPLLLNASRDLAGIFGQTLNPDFQADLLDALSQLLPETEYSDARSGWSVNRRIQLRQIALKLVHSLIAIGCQHSVLDEWIEAARQDVFEDVRRLA